MITVGKFKHDKFINMDSVSHNVFGLFLARYALGILAFRVYYSLNYTAKNTTARGRKLNGMT